MAALTVEHFDQRLGKTEARIGQVEDRLGHVEDRLGQLQDRIGHLESFLIERFERRLAETRVDVLKWSFVFWIGQIAAIAAMLTFALRSVPR